MEARIRLTSGSSPFLGRFNPESDCPSRDLEVPDRYQSPGIYFSLTLRGAKSPPERGPGLEPELLKAPQGNIRPSLLWNVELRGNIL